MSLHVRFRSISDEPLDVADVWNHAGSRRATDFTSFDPSKQRSRLRPGCAVHHARFVRGEEQGDVHAQRRWHPLPGAALNASGYVRESG